MADLDVSGDLDYLYLCELSSHFGSWIRAGFDTLKFRAAKSLPRRPVRLRSRDAEKFVRYLAGSLVRLLTLGRLGRNAWISPTSTAHSEMRSPSPVVTLRSGTDAYGSSS